MGTVNGSLVSCWSHGHRLRPQKHPLGARASSLCGLGHSQNDTTIFVMRE
ncbi:hypothetical protein Syun_003312 [Stephania yunnanensis]|uniref:Uncharacterized protein n=1 Tax=Stephania yunnanensis TaxID=152371 RepID=A0AAP0L1Z5_9MAGN